MSKFDDHIRVICKNAYKQLAVLNSGKWYLYVMYTSQKF